jgi:hypothetical protein
MKKLVITFFISCAVSYGYSQDTTKSVSPVTNVTDGPGKSLQDELSIHFGQTYTRFRFRDTEGAKDTSLNYDFRPAFGINYSKFVTSEIFIRAELGSKNLGAVSILNNQKLDWSLHYLDFNVGGGYIMNNMKLQPYGGVSFYASYLYKATQSYGVYYYDMLSAKSIKHADYGVDVFAGVKYAVSPMNSLFLEVRSATGLNQLETNTGAGQNQHLYNRAVSFHFGVAFNIVK